MLLSRRGRSQMRLAGLKEFRELVYTPRSAPAMSTLRARIDAGLIPGGCVIGRRRYVDLDVFDRATNLSADLHAQRQRLMKSPVLQGLI